MPIPNPHNDVIPEVGQHCRIIGACHPRCLGKVVEIVQVYEYKGVPSYESRHIGNDGDWIYSGGDLGGLEPANGEAVWDERCP